KPCIIMPNDYLIQQCIEYDWNQGIDNEKPERRMMSAFICMLFIPLYCQNKAHTKWSITYSFVSLSFMTFYGMGLNIDMKDGIFMIGARIFLINAGNIINDVPCHFQHRLSWRSISSVRLSHDLLFYWSLCWQMMEVGTAA
ncbi:MAG: hypothetical protein ACLR14_14025, partial [Phocaeicola vulgatus]